MKGSRLLTSFIIFLFLLAAAGCGKDLTDAQFYENAQQHYHKGEIDAAVIQLKNALQKNASNLKARALLGMIYADLGLGAAAEKELRRAILLGASETSYDTYMAKALFEQNKFQDAFDKFSRNAGLSSDLISKRNIILTRASLGLNKRAQAEEYFSKVSKADKTTIPGLYAAIDLAISTRDLKKAKLYVEEILHKNQNEVEAWILKGALAFEEGNAQSAETFYKEALNHYKSRQQSVLTFKANTGLFYAELKQKKYADALKVSKNLLAMAKNNPLPKYLRGLLAFEQKDYATAQNYLEEVYNANPHHLPTLLLLGSIHYIKKNCEQANNFLSTVVNQMPGNIQARKMLAATRLHLSKSTEALEVLNKVVDKNTKDSQLLSMVAAAAIQSGNLEMGETYLKRAQKSNPGNPSLRTELARLYMQKGEYDEAINELDMIKGDQAAQADVLKVVTYLKKKDYANARKIAHSINEKKQTAASITMLGGVELIAGDTSRAVAYFNQALQKDNDYAPALLNLAKVELNEGKSEAAKNHFQRVTQKNPNSLTALMGLAQISEKEGNIKSALAYLQEARSKNDKAVLPRLLLTRYYVKTGDIQAALDNASEAYKIAPKDGVVALLMANVYMANRDAFKAVRVLEALKRAQPKSSGVAYELAKAYLGLKRVNKARDELKRALSINPKLYPAKIVLARLNITDGKYDSAMTEAKSLQKLQPNDAMGYLLEGDVFAAKHQYAKAEQVLRKSIQVKATPLAFEKLAKMLIWQKKPGQAVSELKKGIQTFPKAIVLQIQIASIYQTNKQVSKAIVVYTKLLKEHPNHAVVLNNLALLYLDYGDKRALEYAQKAHNLIPSNPGIADTLGWVYAKQGDYQSALPLLEKAAFQTKLPTIQFHYAYALYHAGNLTKSNRVLKQALNVSNIFDERPDAEKLLKLLTK